MNTDEYEEYIAKAKNSGIFVGDRVQITRKSKKNENGWNRGWNSQKDKTIGKIGQIMSIDSVWDYCIKFDNNKRYYYPYFVLRLVHRTPIVPRFSHGDRVLIQREWKEGENDTRVDFNRKMSNTIGKIGEITSIYLKSNNEFVYGVRFDDGKHWYYPEFVLKKSHKPNSDFEFEPFDTLLHVTGPTLSR